MWKYILFQIAIQTIGRLPLSLSYALATAIGSITYWLSPSRKSVISNLRHVMGAEAPAGDLRRAARRIFVNVTKYYVDLVRMPHSTAQEFYDRRFRYTGFDEYLLPAVREGKGVVALSAHMGNPELAIQGMIPRGVKVFALTEQLSPPRLHNLVDSLRSAWGHDFAPVGYKGVRQVMKRLRSGGVVALMGDRDIHGPKALLPFFGEEAWMPTGPMEVALRTDAVVIPAFCVRTEDDGIVAYMEAPLELQRTGDMEADVRENTLRYLARLEAYLKRYPDQWAVLESIWDGKASEPEAAPQPVGERA